MQSKSQILIDFNISDVSLSTPEKVDPVMYSIFF